MSSPHIDTWGGTKEGSHPNTYKLINMTRFSLSSRLEYNQNVTKTGSVLTLSNFQWNRIMKKKRKSRSNFLKMTKQPKNSENSLMFTIKCDDLSFHLPSHHGHPPPGCLHLSVSDNRVVELTLESRHGSGCQCGCWVSLSPGNTPHTHTDDEKIQMSVWVRTH